ncbi:MAG: 30S ribosomal protein S6 [Candidatus Omnitrophica bacterium]|nr:30S ribosomal protein S6 [Candidatus Omnitrophota bacterium]
MTQTRGYESLIILKASGTDQDVARNVSQLEEPIKKMGGTVERSQGMGRRRLAFRIARHTEGYYYLLRFQVPPDRIGEIERLFRLNETIIRFMILNAEGTSPVAAAGPARQAGPMQHAAQPRS